MYKYVHVYVVVRLADLLRSSSTVVVFLFFFLNDWLFSVSSPSGDRKLPAYVTPVETLENDENSEVHVMFVLLSMYVPASARL